MVELKSRFGGWVEMYARDTRGLCWKNLKIYIYIYVKVRVSHLVSRQEAIDKSVI